MIVRPYKSARPTPTKPITGKLEPITRDIGSAIVGDMNKLATPLMTLPSITPVPPTLPPTPQPGGGPRRIVVKESPEASLYERERGLSFVLEQFENHACVTSHDVRTFMDDLNLPFMSDYDLREKMLAAGAGATGFNDLNSFFVFIQNELKDWDETKAIEAFQYFDESAGGFVDEKTLRRVITKLGDHMDEDDADKVIEETDIYQDGCISYDKVLEKFEKQYNPLKVKEGEQPLPQPENPPGLNISHNSGKLLCSPGSELSDSINSGKLPLSPGHDLTDSNSSGKSVFSPGPVLSDRTDLVDSKNGKSLF